MSSSSLSSTPDDELFGRSFGSAEADAIKSALGGKVTQRLLFIAQKPSEIIDPSLSPRIVRLSSTEWASGESPSGGGVMQGDLARLPFRDGLFDVVVSTRALNRIPSAIGRREHIAEMARVLVPRGRGVFTVGQYNFRMVQKGWLKEGIEEGVYHFRYGLEELRSDLEISFEVEYIHGFWIYLPKTYRLYVRLGQWSVYWERALRRKNLSLTYGKFLLAACRRR